MNDEELLAVIYENQNRLVRTLGTKRSIHKGLRGAFPSKPIKVVIGFRRSGKSWLCMQVAKDLAESGVFFLKNVLFLNFEDYRLSGLRGPVELDWALGIFAARVAAQGPRLLILDEIQTIPGWERFLRSLHERDEGWDILVTGSNSELLSSELAGKLAGRHIVFEILPFSFSEFVLYRGLSFHGEAEYYRQRRDLDRLWDDFIMLGGLPERFSISDPLAVRSYHEGIVAKVILDDVIKRFKVEQVAALERLAGFLLASPGQIVSFAALGRRLSAFGSAIKVDTVIRYVGYLMEAFAVFDLSRFDWKQGRYFDTTRKYYAVDTGIAALYRSPVENRAFLIENAVYLELRRRGGRINFGALENGKELDFIVEMPGREWLKIQVTKRLDADNEARELSSFLLAEPYLAMGESLMLMEEGERRQWSAGGVPIRAESVIRWALEEPDAP